ncbi:hypothetical protein KCU59_g153, partial [Aureobasidium melanogenum]
LTVRLQDSSKGGMPCRMHVPAWSQALPDVQSPLFKLSTDSRCLRFPNSLIVFSEREQFAYQMVSKGHVFAVLMTRTWRKGKVGLSSCP